MRGEMEVQVEKPKAKLTPADVRKRIAEEGIRWADLQFVDVLGALQHITIPSAELDDKTFNAGIGKLDGSSIKGFKAIYDSDMNLQPDPETFVPIPWETGNARIFCNIWEAAKGGRFVRDSRYIAERAENAMKDAGFDVSYWGPELEFFLFDSVTIDASAPHKGQGYQINSREAAWNTTADGKATPIRFKEGYYPAPPTDTLQNIRTQIANTLMDHFDTYVEAHHHEVATAGQCEIDMRYDELKRMADKVVTYKYVVKNIAAQNNMIATFMPKPMFGDNGSGMHVHQSVWKDGRNLCYDPDEPYAEMSQTLRYYIGGLMEHARALAAICSPTTNSYRRLVPGYEAPVYIAWSKRNRSATCRVPVYDKGIEKAKRVEYRPPDPSCNPYLAFSAMLMAGLDGIKKKMDCGNPVDENIWHLSPQKRRELGIGTLPGSLEEALQALQSDDTFLRHVFGDMIETHIELKTHELKQNALRPTPWEFQNYLDC